MEKDYSLNFATAENELDKLGDVMFYAQLMYWAHEVDDLLSGDRARKNELLIKQVPLLAARISVYSIKYGERNAGYRWAVSVCDIGERAINRKANESMFIPDDLGDTLIMRIIESAGWIPCKYHKDAYRYVIIRSKENKERFKSSGVDIKNASCVIAIVADKQKYNAEDTRCDCYKLGAPIQNVVSSAYYYGLAACYLADEGLKSDAIQSLITLEKNEEVLAFVLVGYYEKIPIYAKYRRIDRFARYC